LLMIEVIINLESPVTSGDGFRMFERDIQAFETSSVVTGETTNKSSDIVTAVSVMVS